MSINDRKGQHRFVPTQFPHWSSVRGCEERGVRSAITNDGQMEKQCMNEICGMPTTHARTMIKYILIGGGRGGGGPKGGPVDHSPLGMP